MCRFLEVPPLFCQKSLQNVAFRQHIVAILLLPFFIIVLLYRIFIYLGWCSDVAGTGRPGSVRNTLPSF